MVLKHFVAVVAFVVVASAGMPARAAGQEQRQEPRPPQAATAAAQRDQLVQARYNIFVMEGVLERAVAHGADRLRRQVRRVMPDMLLLSGEAQARGFRLDGYGVFFDVAVPVMRQSVAWHLRTMVQESGFPASTALQQLRTAIERMTDQGEKAMLMQAIKRLEFQVGVSPQGPGPALAAQRPGEPGGVAAGVAGGVAPGAPSTSPGSVTALTAQPEQQAPTVSAEDTALLEDPNAAYEREVIGALVDAMLNHSGSIGVGPDEWLTVAAHDNEQRNRLMPGDPYDLLTIVLRMKGSDLAAFRAERITREEARKRVLISEF